MSNYQNNLIPKFKREWDETIQGYEDEEGFFYTPEGSKALREFRFLGS